MKWFKKITSKVQKELTKDEAFQLFKREYCYGKKCQRNPNRNDCNISFCFEDHGYENYNIKQEELETVLGYKYKNRK
jgi:hypothetical protein